RSRGCSTATSRRTPSAERLCRVSDPVTRDTIAAIATPAGRGGIGVVRVSGPEVPRMARTILGRLPQPRLATFGALADVDKGIALYFPAPHSYTGEPVLELQGHG